MIITANLPKRGSLTDVTVYRQDDGLPGLLFERFSNKLVRMCHKFYQDPKNEEAYQAWRAARQQKEEIVWQPQL